MDDNRLSAPEGVIELAFYSTLLRTTIELARAENMQAAIEEAAWHVAATKWTEWQAQNPTDHFSLDIDQGWQAGWDAAITFYNESLIPMIAAGIARANGATS